MSNPTSDSKPIDSRRRFLGQAMLLFSLPFLPNQSISVASSRSALPPDDWMARIVADPDNETLRLAYADWLSQQGNPLGQMIKLECDLAHADRTTARFYAAETQQARLNYEAAAWKDSHAAKWIGEGYDQISATAPSAKFHAKLRRGMLEELQVTNVAEFLAHHEDIFRQAPLIRCLTVEESTDSEALSGLFRSPSLRKIRELTFYNCRLEKSVFSAWSASDMSSSVRRLELDNCQLDADGISLLLRNGQLAKLESLAILSSEFVDQQDFADNATLAQTLLSPPACPTLTSIDVRNCPFVAVAAGHELARGKVPRGLKELTLDVSQIATDDIEAFLRNAPPQLSSLAFSRGNHHGIHLALEGLSRLEKLSLGDMHLDDQAAMDIARSAPPCLRDLRLQGGTICCAELLAESSRLHNVRFLNLGDNNLQSRGAAALVESPYLTELVALKLGWNKIDARGCQRIASAKNARNLRFLHLGDNQVGDEGILALGASNNLSQLNWLNLDNNGISEKAIMELLDSPKLPSLIALRADDFHSEGDTAKRFAERFGMFDFIASYAFYGRLI